MGSNSLSISSAVPCPDLKVIIRRLRVCSSFLCSGSRESSRFLARPKRNGRKGARAKAQKVEAGRLSKTGRVVTVPASILGVIDEVMSLVPGRFRVGVIFWKRHLSSTVSKEARVIAGRVPTFPVGRRVCVKYPSQKS